MGEHEGEPGLVPLRGDATRAARPGWLAVDSMRPPLIGSRLSGQRVAWLNGEEACAMLSAYVLIETEVCKAAHVAKRSATWMVCSWPRISPAPYDLIARVQAPGLDQRAAGGLPIQVVDGVTRTLTCMVIQR